MMRDQAMSELFGPSSASLCADGGVPAFRLRPGLSVQMFAQFALVIAATR